MGKTRVHELAAEFGIPAEQLVTLLKGMNIFVRTHMSALEPDQVAAVRVRWEREKRKPAVEDALSIRLSFSRLARNDASLERAMATPIWSYE